MSRLSVLTVTALLLSSACGRKEQRTAPVQLAAVERRDIVVDVEATGVVEPINVVEVKSKASGQITRMPVETGSQVRPGDLLVQLDTRDVQNQYDQVAAEVRAARAKLDVSAAQKKRADELHAQRIITSQEHEAATIDFANAQAAVVRARTNLDLAKQRLEDATVRAPITGTVIDKTVSLGQVITSATGSASGGTTLLKMADLTQVRVRALVNETDIGNVRPGQTATVTVDAYPDRPFRGAVEKIEPQAVVQQSVTMFPVLITIENREGFLKPGMNGEASLLVDRRENVLSVPNDAVRNVRDAASAATLLGLDPAAVQSQLQTQMASLRGGPERVSDVPGASGPTTVISRGEVALEPQQRQRAATPGQAGAVTDAQCAAVRTAIERSPGAQQKLTAIRERMRSGELDAQQAMAEARAIYLAASVDPPVAGACRRREGRRAGTTQAAGTTGGDDAASAMGTRARVRPGLIFVAGGGTYAPKVVMLGVSNYDYTEVIRGAEEGDSVAILSAAAMQAQRQMMQDRMRNMGGVPGMQRQTPAGGGAGGGAGRRQ